MNNKLLLNKQIAKMQKGKTFVYLINREEETETHTHTERERTLFKYFIYIK